MLITVIDWCCVVCYVLFICYFWLCGYHCWFVFCGLWFALNCLLLGLLFCFASLLLCIYFHPFVFVCHVLCYLLVDFDVCFLLLRFVLHMRLLVGLLIGVYGVLVLLLLCGYVGWWFVLV